MSNAVVCSNVNYCEIQGSVGRLVVRFSSEVSFYDFFSFVGESNRVSQQDMSDFTTC